MVHLRTNLGFEEPYGELLERAGSFGFHREQGAVGMTIGRARGVVTLFNSTFEGWREHSSSTVTQGAARFALPLDERTRLGILLDAVSDLHRFPGALTQAQLDADPEQASVTYLSRDERRRNRVGRIGLTLDRGLATNQDLALNLFVEPKVLQRSERGRFRDFNRYHLGSSATYQLHSTLGPGITGRTMIGGDEAYQDGSILFYGLNPDGSRATNVIANKREAANGLGGFLEQDLTWNERWSVRLAGRWDQLMYLSEDHIDPQLDADKTFRRFTPKGSLSYALDHHTVYVALGGGVEAPAFNEIDPAQIIRGKYDLDVVGHYARPDIFDKPQTGGGGTTLPFSNSGTFPAGSTNLGQPFSQFCSSSDVTIGENTQSRLHCSNTVGGSLRQ